jgi:hypothetical protein
MATSTTRWLLHGAAAGAAGTTALDIVTYLDMAVRGRGASRTPERTVERIADKAHLPIPGDAETRGNRVSGLGPLLGLAMGVGGGAALGALRAAGLRPPLPVTAALTAGGVMAAANGPMAVLGITDPRAWSTVDWLSDAIPHAAYGLVTAWTLRELARR